MNQMVFILEEKGMKEFSKHGHTVFDNSIREQKPEAGTHGLGKDGKLTGVKVQEIEWKPNPEGGRPIMVPVGKPEIIKAEMVLLAMGFLKPEQPTFADNVYVAGDAASGASLVVRAMASGAEQAKKIIERFG